MTQFDWKKVPSTADGFVDYPKIPSMQVRLLIAKAEYIKLSEELRAREKWRTSESNQSKILAIKNHVQIIKRLYPEAVC
ncbi:hypothetical protein [uncultured Endozoicomonas sp.]|uniref:hypothetical protein n=1 Tax=uncultured Endozoicomonas sp. TaxID=432652 RepID=UPI002621C3CA|nr:hypothetical protein [uncultured Endozoicomonas sp.]